jgi:TPR repeat protein
LYQKGFDALERKDYEEALRYYQSAAAKGSADAMNDLGYFYEVAEGYIDEKASFEWYTRGVEAGSPHAANGLGNCYQHGLGTTADVAKAIELYEQSAEKQVPYAHYNLGLLYYDGLHMEKDNEKALKHFVYASRHGIECHNYVGVLLEPTGEYKSAFNAYKEGLKYNDADCAFNMARLYEQGLGCKADPRKSLSYYMKAVEWGAIDAHLQLRRLYLFNELVRDEVKAMEHEQLARDAGIEIPE